jgi:aryl-alcohol dehydrogenase (NADP+)
LQPLLFSRSALYNRGNKTHFGAAKSSTQAKIALLQRAEKLNRRTTMQYTILKSTGLKVSRMCLGTMTFGGQADKEESRRIFDFCLDHGVNFVDTADIYTNGQSETFVGEFMKGRRDEIVLATKVGGPSAKGQNGMRLSRKHILESVDMSLSRLRTDYIDIYYMHFPDAFTPYEEIISTMDMLVRSGKIRYYGTSNHAAWQCCSMVHLAREMNCVPPVLTQTVYNLLTRGAEDELIPFMEKYNYGITVFNPLAGGLLTGKHKRGKPVENTRMSEKGYAMRYFKDSNFDAMDILTKAAEENGMSLLELSYKWLLSQKAVDSIICGVSKFSQITQNMEYFKGSSEEPKNTPLPESVLAQCDEAWNLLRGKYWNYHY